MSLTGAEKTARYRARHPERAAESNRRGQRARRERSPELVRLEDKAARERRYGTDAYRETMRRARVKRRRLRGGTQLKVPAAYAALLRADPCSYCGKPSGTLDHVEPLSKGGSDTYDNLVGACRSCNARKNNRSLLSYLLEMRHG